MRSIINWPTAATDDERIHVTISVSGKRLFKSKAVRKRPREALFDESFSLSILHEDDAIDAEVTLTKGRAFAQKSEIVLRGQFSTRDLLHSPGSEKQIALTVVPGYSLQDEGAVPMLTLSCS